MGRGLEGGGSLLESDDMIAHLHRCHSFPDRFDDPGALMAEHYRKGAFRVFSWQSVCIYGVFTDILSADSFILFFGLSYPRNFSPSCIMNSAYQYDRPQCNKSRSEPHGPWVGQLQRPRWRAPCQIPMLRQPTRKYKPVCRCVCFKEIACLAGDCLGFPQLAMTFRQGGMDQRTFPTVSPEDIVVICRWNSGLLEVEE